MGVDPLAAVGLLVSFTGGSSDAERFGCTGCAVCGASTGNSDRKGTKSILLHFEQSTKWPASASLIAIC